MTEPINIRSAAFVASLGMDISIQLVDSGKRLKSELVGMRDPQYLILRLPQPLSLSREIQEGTDLILRYVHFGSVYGCMVKVCGLILKPFPLLFLTFPTEVQCIELRKAQRVECMLPATATGATWEESGLIRDISTGGVLFCTKTGADNEGPSISIGEGLLLSFPLLGVDGLQEFSGRIRRIMRDREELCLGVEFDALPSEITKKIETYLETVAIYNE